MTEEGDKDSIERYRNMRDILRKPKIMTLAFIDSNTTGLRGKNWDNLIFKEGTPTAGDGKTKGGSFGFGKNAPFNLS